MKNLKISAKLIVSYLVVIVLAVAIGVVGIIGMQQLNQAQSDLYDSHLVAIEAMADLRELFGNERNDIRNIFLNKDNSAFDLNAAIAKFDTYAVKASDSFSLYESTIDDASAESEYYGARDAYIGPFATMKKQMFEQLKQGDFDGAYKTFMDGGAVIAPITNGFATGTANNNQWAKDADNEGNALYVTLTIALIAILAVAVIVSIIFAVYISGLISKPVIFMRDVLKQLGIQGKLQFTEQEYQHIKACAQVKDEIGESMSMLRETVRRLTRVGTALETVANGDLTAELALLSQDDTIGLSLKKMTENLNNMFSEINNSTSQVSTGSKQIADGAQALAQGSTEQAAAVEQLSSSISEIADKTRENANMAGKAATLAATIKTNAEKGTRQMDEMTAAVKDINDASQSISKVIKVIDDIAFQTNILALNAAVEAARAGQHGKGFAVVAEEVRSLAAKSAEAAKDTSSMIANSIEKAELGARIADETSASLTDIVSGINESNQIVSDIARSSEEQSLGITQINKGIDQVAQVVQQNSATAEESAAASEEMSSQANLLEELITQFKLRDAGSRRISAAPKSPAKTLSMPEKTVYTPEKGFGKY